MRDSKIKRKIKSAYLRFVKREGRLPSMRELPELGTTVQQIRSHFGSVPALKSLLADENPEIFAGLINESVFTKRAMDDLQDLVGSKRVAVITTAVAGAPVHAPFLRALEAYVEQRDGVLLIIPVADPAAAGGFQFDPKLGRDRFVYRDLRLNDSLYVSTIKMSAKQIDPTTGISRLGHRRSFIFGSPKQRTVFKPNAQSRRPHVFMGTGAVTKPSYGTDRYMSERTAYLADVDHVMGALIVEIEDDRTYHFRQVQANGRGEFADLGQLHKPNGTSIEYAPRYAVLGDLHAGDEDPQALEGSLEVIRKTGAKDVVLHDVVDGRAISHHVEGRIIEKSLQAEEDKTSVATEGQQVADSLRYILSEMRPDGHIYIVASNHDDFYYRYLNSKRWIHDYENLPFVSRHLLPAALRGENPAQALAEHFMTDEVKSRVTWWKQNEDFRFANVLLSAHGDLGPNGSKGTIKNHAESYGPCIIGHCLTGGHSVNVYRKGWIPIQDVTVEDKVLGYDPVSKSNTWTNVKDTQAYNYSGILLEIGDKRWRQVVTDAHYMFTEDGQYVPVLEAIRDVPLHKIPIVAGSTKEEEEFPISDNLLRIIIAVCADGHFGKTCGELRFHFRKERKINRILDLFTLEGETLKKNTQSSGSIKLSLSKKSPIYSRICELVDIQNKILPSWMLRMSTRQKEIFADELHKWGGSKATKTSFQFGSAKKEESDIVQSILNELGYKNRRLTRIKDRYAAQYIVTYNMDRKSYMGKLNKDLQFNRWGVVPHKVESEPTFCLTTGTSNFWVRHEGTGTVSLTGNSHTAGIFREAYQVGTTTELKLSYNRGPGSWTHSLCLLYPNGSRQLIHLIDGKWTIGNGED